MATYEDDHNLPSSSTLNPPPTRRARPDLTVFFSTLDLNSSSQNPHSHNTNDNENEATGGSNADAFRLLAQAWNGEGGEVMEGLIQQLLEESEMHKATQGVPQEFLDGLERIPKKQLVEADICPICNMSFLSDQYPLVVRLPCHKSHAFDLDCIAPWLRLHTTCPLDRIDLTKKKTPPPPPVEEEEEEEWDENYG